MGCIFRGVCMVGADELMHDINGTTMGFLIRISGADNGIVHTIWNSSGLTVGMVAQKPVTP